MLDAPIKIERQHGDDRAEAHAREGQERHGCDNFWVRHVGAGEGDAKQSGTEGVVSPCPRVWR